MLIVSINWLGLLLRGSQGYTHGARHGHLHEARGPLPSSHSGWQNSLPYRTHSSLLLRGQRERIILIQEGSRSFLLGLSTEPLWPIQLDLPFC